MNVFQNHFQNKWTTCLPWVEFEVDAKGDVH